jgi:hypothetical protein
MKVNQRGYINLLSDLDGLYVMMTCVHALTSTKSSLVISPSPRRQPDQGDEERYFGCPRYYTEWIRLPVAYRSECGNIHRAYRQTRGAPIQYATLAKERAFINLCDGRIARPHSFYAIRLDMTQATMSAKLRLPHTQATRESLRIVITSSTYLRRLTK